MKLTLKYGLITGLIISLIDGLNILYLYQQPLGQYAPFFNIGVLAVGITAGIKHIARARFENDIPYPQASLSGILIAVYSGVILGISSFIIFSFTNQQFIAYYIETAHHNLLQQGISEEEVEKQINEIKAGFTPFRIALNSLINSFLFGLFISLLAAFFIRKNQKKELN